MTEEVHTWLKVTAAAHRTTAGVVLAALRAASLAPELEVGGILEAAIGEAAELDRAAKAERKSEKGSRKGEG